MCFLKRVHLRSEGRFRQVEANIAKPRLRIRHDVVIRKDDGACIHQSESNSRKWKQ